MAAASQLSTKYRNQVTWNGYPMDTMKSALQKYIRRGNAAKALYCAGEMDLFKEASDASEGEGLRTNLFNRILILFMEDVENLSIMRDVDQAVRFLYAERKKAPEERKTAEEERVLAECVILLSKSEKARVASHLRAVFNPIYEALHEHYPSLQPYWDELKENDRTRKEPSDLAYYSERFTYYLRQKSLLALPYAFKIAASEETLPEKIMRSSKPVWFLFKSLLAENKEMTEIPMGWYKDYLQNVKENFLCWMIPLLHVLGIIPTGHRPVMGADEAALPRNWDMNRANVKMELDDYVLDRHTKAGRKKSLVEFATVGAYVENEAAFVSPVWKTYYEDGKRYEENVPIVGEKGIQQPIAVTASTAAKEIVLPMRRRKAALTPATPVLETAAYNFVVRAQLTTSGFKMDVYFAHDTQTGAFVVVKGPYANRKEIDIVLRNTEWKKKNGLPYQPVQVRELIPDRWPEGVPLGARNKIDRTKPAYFLVFDSVVPENKLVTRIHSSKVWPDTEVVDWDKVPMHFDYQSPTLTDQQIKDYVHAVLYRYVLGISDLADRNFIMANGRVFSIDEDVENHEVNLYQNLHKNKAAFLYRWLQTHYEDLEVDQWTVSEQETARLKKLHEIQNRDSCLRLFYPGHLPSASASVSITAATVHPVEEFDEKESFLPSKPAETSIVSDNAAAPRSTLATPVAAKPETVVPISSRMSSDNFVLIDNIYRSRMTLLDLLDTRGYNVDAFRKFSPAEATAAATPSAFGGLSFVVSKKDNPELKCDVRYIEMTTGKLTLLLDKLTDEEMKNTEYIMMMKIPVSHTHHMFSLSQYMQPSASGEKKYRGLRVSFFSLYAMVNNPLHHVLVPKHEIVPEAEHKALLESMHVTSKSKLPEIKYHVDPIARCIGAVPGDIVKITRFSPASGEAIIYRVCSP